MAITLAFKCLLISVCFLSSGLSSFEAFRPRDILPDDQDRTSDDALLEVLLSSDYLEQPPLSAMEHQHGIKAIKLFGETVKIKSDPHPPPDVDWPLNDIFQPDGDRLNDPEFSLNPFLSRKFVPKHHLNHRRKELSDSSMTSANGPDTVYHVLRKNNHKAHHGVEFADISKAGHEGTGKPVVDVSQSVYEDLLPSFEKPNTDKWNEINSWSSRMPVKKPSGKTESRSTHMWDIRGLDDTPEAEMETTGLGEITTSLLPINYVYHSSPLKSGSEIGSSVLVDALDENFTNEKTNPPKLSSNVAKDNDTSNFLNKHHLRQTSGFIFRKKPKALHHKKSVESAVDHTSQSSLVESDTVLGPVEQWTLIVFGLCLIWLYLLYSLVQSCKSCQTAETREESKKLLCPVECEEKEAKMDADSKGLLKSLKKQKSHTGEDLLFLSSQPIVPTLQHFGIVKDGLCGNSIQINTSNDLKVDGTENDNHICLVELTRERVSA